MPNPEREMRLGELQSKYGPNLLKTFLNLIIGGGFLLIASYPYLFFRGSDPLEIVVWFVPFALPGLIFLFLVFNQLRKFVEIHEQGMFVRLSRKPPRVIRFDEIEGITPDVRRSSARPTLRKVINGYILVLGDKQKIAFGSDIRRWGDLAQEIEGRVANVRVPIFLNRLSKGEKLSFEVKTGVYFNPIPLRLTLSLDGVQVNDGTPIPWDKIKITVRADDWNTMIAWVQTGGEPVAFMLESYPTMAYPVINGYLESRKSQRVVR